MRSISGQNQKGLGDRINRQSPSKTGQKTSKAIKDVNNSFIQLDPIDMSWTLYATTSEYSFFQIHRNIY